jgi:hypothetical protein
VTVRSVTATGDVEHAPDEYAVDVVVDGEFDNVPVRAGDLEALSPG